MKPSLFIALLIATTALADPPAGRPLYRYQTTDVPNALSTTINGISDDRQVVGVFTDADRRQHGFRLKGATLNVIDYPGAIQTAARGIAPNGDIVGHYRLAGEPAVNIHGFLMSRDGVFNRMDYRARTSTIPQRILAGGVVLGCAHDRDTMASMHGVILTSSAQSELDMQASMHNGATPDLSLIAGLYTDMETMKARAYMILDGEFIPFDYPDALSTAAWDVNPSGAIVGVYQDAKGAAHGFLLDDGEFTSIDFPDALETRAFGINARGDVAGSYVDAAKRTHGFIARRRVIVPRGVPE